MSLRSKSVCVLFYCILKEYGFYLVFYFKTEVLIVNDQNFWPSSELNINMYIMFLNCVTHIILSISSVLTNIQKHVKHVGGKENFSNSWVGGRGGGGRQPGTNENVPASSSTIG